MTSMNYCKYENTLSLMRQVNNDPEPSNEEEEKFKQKLIEACASFLEMEGYSVEDDSEMDIEEDDSCEL